MIIRPVGVAGEAVDPCVTLICCPATRMVAIRGAVSELAVNEYERVPDPELPGPTVTHNADALAVQLQPLEVDTFSVPVVALRPTLIDPGETENEQADWFTVAV